MLDYVEVIRTESMAFRAAFDGLALDTPVPSCPDWTASDLLWHLTEVQEFWANVVEGLEPDQMERIDRPADDLLLGAFVAQSGHLIGALAAANPEAACWSWYDNGRHVGWVRRRQAHEALIHRVDAELTAGSIGPVDEDLATDGIDEILSVMLDVADLPDWATFTPDGRRVAITVPGARRWVVGLGRFVGTSPNTGIDYDEPALQLLPGEGGVDATVSGSAADVNLWLWGRGSADRLEVDGDESLVEAIRRSAVSGTQ